MSGQGDPASLPSSLPIPQDDGAVAHLAGLRPPDLSLPTTAGGTIRLSKLETLTILFVYPMTGRPGVPLPDGWDGIPGARGCTPEACGFRDHHAELSAAGATVLGLSSQPSQEQQEAASRLWLPFPLISDEHLETAQALRLPTFEVAGRELFKRLTLIVRWGRIDHVFYPVFPPDRHAEEVLEWLRGAPA